MVIAGLVAVAFLTLSLLHVYWASGGQWGSEAAIPEMPVRSDAILSQSSIHTA